MRELDCAHILLIRYRASVFGTFHGSNIFFVFFNDVKSPLIFEALGGDRKSHAGSVRISREIWHFFWDTPLV